MTTLMIVAAASFAGGVCFGILLLALCVAAGDADRGQLEIDFSKAAARGELGGLHRGR